MEYDKNDFCVYIDYLKKQLNNVKAGCIIDDALINHLMYADDTVLLATSAKGLSLLFIVCLTYAIKYNNTKM